VAATVTAVTAVARYDSGSSIVKSCETPGVEAVRKLGFILAIR
jgi:hypothetical protein